MGAFQNLQGNRYGRWLVLRHINGRLWECRCDCGNIKNVVNQNLKRGASMSCGCLRVELITKHGKLDAPEYNVWRGMIQRCTAGDDHKTRNYKKRGITVCPRWAVSFEAFLEDMGPRPSLKHSIERIDNDGNYEPGNCRWATMPEQHRNTRRTRFITVNGDRMCVADAALICGLHPTTVLRRLQKGMSETEAATRKSARASS